MLKDHISWVLWCWTALSPLLFRLLPGRDAAIACLVAGWAFLPVAPYPPTALHPSGRKSSFHAVAVPTSPPINKATAIGLGCLVGVLAFDRKAVGRLRWERVDLPVMVWCLVPIASAVANRLPLSVGLEQARQLVLSWGVPYLMGRTYLADEDSRARFAVALAAGGLAYLPVCALELVAGPTVYRLAYGPHPYEFEGSERFLLSRPLGWMEHGNQLGLWMATSAVAATWLWASGAVKRPGGIPGRPLAAVLVGATLLCQSLGSILLLGLALLVLALVRFPSGRFGRRNVALALLGLGALAGGIWLARKGLDVGSLRLAIADLFKGAGKQSFTWRLARTEELLPTALRRPWLGWGRADWRADGLPWDNPVNLPSWLLALGMYGSVGLASLIALWTFPPWKASRHGAYRRWCGPSAGATGALVAIVTINFLDGFSNAVAILPVLYASGGLGGVIARPPAAS